MVKDHTILVEKLSRKLSEMTIVVHKLFKKYHEHEIMFLTLKKAIEQHLRKDKEKLETETESTAPIEEQIPEIDDQEKSNLILQIESQNKIHEAKVEELCELLRKKDEALEVQMNESSRLQSALLAKDTELSSHSSSKESELEIKHYEIVAELDKLQSDSERANEQLSDVCSERDSLLKKLHTVELGFHDEISTLKQAAEDMRISFDQERQQSANLNMKVKDLTEEIRQLKLKKASSTKTTRTSKGSPNDIEMLQKLSSKDKEIQILHSLLQKYKLELANRDKNFNKVFTDKQHVTMESVSTLPGHTNARRNLTGISRSVKSKSDTHLPQLSNISSANEFHVRLK